MTDTPDLLALQDRLLAAAGAAADLPALDAVRVEALGKQGHVTALLKSLGRMTPEERLAEGPRIHSLREAVADAVAGRRAALEQAALDRRLAAERLDLTLPADAAPPGSVHPVSQVMDELAEIFADLGFSVASGPEIEDDWHNFTALNIPETHPARAMHDTFYVARSEASTAGGEPGSPSDGGGSATDAARVAAGPARDGQSPSSDGGLCPPPAGAEPSGSGRGRFLLRTHTSPVQIRAMMAGPPPLRIIAPGRVYRSDWDATHTPMFHQVEGLVIDRGIHLGHLKWTLETFLRAFFERDDIVLRLRPSYFPFTEPSVEVDVGWHLENGRRRLGGADGWMELLGSGMVHAKVIRACGLDPAEWQGFAFGVGVDRLAMLKYGMDDLRPFFEADARWTRHYGFSALDVPTLSAGLSA